MGTNKLISCQKYAAFYIIFLVHSFDLSAFKFGTNGSSYTWDACALYQN